MLYRVDGYKSCRRVLTFFLFRISYSRKDYEYMKMILNLKKYDNVKVDTIFVSNSIVKSENEISSFWNESLYSLITNAQFLQEICFQWICQLHIQNIWRDQTQLLSFHLCNPTGTQQRVFDSSYNASTLMNLTYIPVTKNLNVASKEVIISCIYESFRTNHILKKY